MADGNRSQSFVEPSMSVKRKVTIPLGIWDILDSSAVPRFHQQGSTYPSHDSGGPVPNHWSDWLLLGGNRAGATDRCRAFLPPRRGSVRSEAIRTRRSSFRCRTVGRDATPSPNVPTFPRRQFSSPRDQGGVVSSPR